MCSITDDLLDVMEQIKYKILAGALHISPQPFLISATRDDYKFMRN